MPVAPFILGVTRPAVAALPIDTILAYYFDAAGGDNGQIHAYEYGVDGALVGFVATMDLPTTGVFTDYAFNAGTIFARAALVFDGAPGLVVPEHSRGGHWYWRPRTESISPQIYYNQGRTHSTPIYHDGNFYQIRVLSADHDARLYRLDSEFLNPIQLSILAGNFGASGSNNTLASETQLVVEQIGSAVVMPLDGSAPFLEPSSSWITGSYGIPWDNNRSLMAGTTLMERFPRLVPDAAAGPGESFLWPNEGSWLGDFGVSKRVQRLDNYLLAIAGSTPLRVLGGPADAVDGEPDFDFTIPQQGSLHAFLAGIGSTA